MTDGEPSFRRVPVDQLSEEEQRSILGVLEAAFGRWPAFDLPVEPFEHLLWKSQGPAGSPYQVLTEMDGRIVGTQLTFRRRYRVNGREIVVQESMDSALHPDAQGRGAYRKRRDWNKDYTRLTVDLVMSYAVNPVVTANRVRDGSRTLANQIEVMALVFDARRAALEALRRRELPLRQAARFVGARLRRASRPEARRDWSITAVDEFDERVEELFERAASAFDLIQVRDRRMLNWRYCDRRGGEFTVNIAEQGGELLGYAVHRTHEQWGHIVDLLALPDRLDVVDSLLAAALDQLRGRRAAAVTCWMAHEHPYQDALRRRGFIRTTGQAGLACRPERLDESEAGLLWDPHARVHLTQGDSDWY